ncbi:DinB family protein [Saccharomonospora azurea]|uniref:Mini-circle protein n=1 Tax=Saccharomonospora azurea NA-128 TaxID=882081 RepID=H8GF97_9PSEU|nr:DinB family protein [Saccharomonospora azurea]EHY88996.1 hypothetical protein SacazDRAFT_02084 [Saccharomonospora azurea NA-128]
MPPLSADERSMAEGWLDFYRATLALKCAELSDEQVRTASAPPSSLTLQGLVQHMADVERHWFRCVLAGEDLPRIHGSHGGAFEVSADVSLDDARAAWQAEIEVARKNCAAHALDDTRPFPHGGEVSLRWIYTHMIAEYARHCGHADLIRERIDGTTGV